MMVDNRRRLESERGLGVVELLIAMSITAIVVAVAAALVLSVTRAERITGDDSAALTELRIASTRLTKELREGTEVVSTSTSSAVSFWVDADRDGVKDIGEVVTWTIVPESTRSARLVRSTDAADTVVVIAVGLLTTSSFAYEPALPDSPLVVRIVLLADIREGDFPSERSVETAVTLRNGPIA